MPTLNVVLHGLMAICEKGDKLLIFLPDVTEVHVFRAGSWLAETEIVPRAEPYRLTGVTPDNAGVDRATNLFLGDVHLPENANAAAHAVLELDRPKEMRGIRTVEITPDEDFEGRDLDRVTGSTRIATAQLLVYDCPDLSQIALDGHDWTPLEQPGTGAVNLHVFAEEELPDEGTAEHALQAFADMVTGVTGLDLRLKRAQDVPDFDPDLDILPASVTPMETEDFSKRQGRLRNFALQLRVVLPKIGAPGPYASINPQTLLEPFSQGHPIGSKTGSCTLIAFRAA
jgi:hypothetical protein